jgi:hypothetical protein
LVFIYVTDSLAMEPKCSLLLAQKSVMWPDSGKFQISLYSQTQSSVIQYLLHGLVLLSSPFLKSLFLFLWGRTQNLIVSCCITTECLTLLCYLISICVECHSFSVII